MANKTATAKGSDVATVDAHDPSRLTDEELDAQTRPTIELDPDNLSVDNLPELEDAENAHEEGPVDLNAQAEARFASDHQMVSIRIRRNLVRTKIGDTWYTFKKGEERDVPRWVADWLTEQGYL